MAEKKFSELTAKGATIADTDLVAISESAGGGTYVSKRVTGANIKALVTDANMTTTDITTNDVSTSKHGFAPKAPNDGTKFLDGLGAYDTVKDSDLSLSDITTNDVSTTKHGFVPKAPNDTTKFLRGDGTWQVPAAGGLTEFTEAETTATPNATVPVNSLTPVTATTNADIAIVPKGTGAFTLAVADNTTTGGNKRGTNAIDLQTSRTNADQVASGNNSIVIGTNCKASSIQGVAIGTGASATGYGVALNSYGNVTAANAVASGTGSFAVNGGLASAQWAFSMGRAVSSNLNAFSYGGYSTAVTASGSDAIAMSEGNTASGNYSLAIGGTSNTSSGSWSVAIGGAENTANGSFSFAHGYQSHVFGIYGRKAYASGREAVNGDAQASKFILHERTTGNTATTITTDSAAASTTNQVILSSNSCYRFKGTIVGKKSGTTDVAAWDIDGLIVRGANAASTVLNVSNVTLVQNTPAWGTPTLAADTTNGGLRVQVTGAASTNIQWTAVIETTEVIYA